MPMDIDSRRIPANPAKREGEHVHHDFIYLFRLESAAEVRPQRAEVKVVRWMPRQEFAALPAPRFARLDRKLQALHRSPPGEAHRL
jgi:ADP-ribose pyrophosphatase YjhB (NUDIX family)